MKKIILGFIVGLIVAVPAGAFAWNATQMSRPVFGFDCAMASKVDANDNYIYDSNNNRIPDPTSNDSRCSGTVYVFDDAGNKCYVAKVSNGAGIDCVRE